MRPIRARFTTRGMMIAVAATALAIFSVQTARRWAHYREEYRAKADIERLSRESLLHPGPIGVCGMARPSQEELEAMKADQMKYCLVLVNHFRTLKEKYALAMSRPWLPVPPDPPLPE